MVQPLSLGPNDEERLRETELAIWRYAETVYRLALSRTRDVHNAEDVFQEVFLRLLKWNKPFESEEHRRAWLIRVTINACHDLRRSVWSRNRTELPENLADSFETPQDNALYAAVFSLPEKYRVVVLLYYYEDYSIQEISEMIQRNPSTIQTQLERARKKLKMQLEQKGGFHYGQTAIQACHGTNSDV